MERDLTIDFVATQCAQALTSACSVHLGGEATAAPTDVPAADGWRATVAVSGDIEGRLVIWFDQASALAGARVSAGEGVDVGDADAATFVTAMVQTALDALGAQPHFGGTSFGAPKVGTGQAVPGGRGSYAVVANTASLVFSVAIDPESVAALPEAGRRAAPNDGRLTVVLDMELPVTVRFGRTVMPLRAVADLGPGSVIDLDRSPEEPADVMVGDRVIARGEVVVVGGQYGVRITQVLAGRADAAALARV